MNKEIDINTLMWVGNYTAWTVIFVVAFMMGEYFVGVVGVLMTALSGFIAKT